MQAVIVDVGSDAVHTDVCCIVWMPSPVTAVLGVTVTPIHSIRKYSIGIISTHCSTGDSPPSLLVTGQPVNSQVSLFPHTY